MKILIADTNLSDCQKISDFLKKEGHQIFIAKNSADALKIAENESPNFIFLDADFSKGRSLETLQELTRIAHESTVMMMGNEGAIAFAEEAALAGSIGFIRKDKSAEMLKELNLALKKKTDPRIKAKVLIVDDEQPIRNMLSSYLQKKGYAILEAPTGADALAKIKEENPELVLLDYMMPGMNGLEALQKIKDVQPNVSVIMVTGNTEEWVWKRARALGASDYLAKPVDLKYLDLVLMTKIAFME